jgi:hypothetical protein
MLLSSQHLFHLHYHLHLPFLTAFTFPVKSITSHTFLQNQNHLCLHSWSHLLLQHLPFTLHLNSLSSFTVCTFPLTLLILFLLLRIFCNSTYIASFTQLSLKPLQFHICCYPWVSFFWKTWMFGNLRKGMNVWNSEIFFDTTAKRELRLTVT